MNNYKIKVNGTHPLEYQDILDVASELGYDNEGWGNLYNLNYLFLNDDGSVGFSLNGESVSDEHQELTLPQLRDLVVLHRNDPKDGNYSLFISDSQGELNLYKTADDVFYVFSRQLKGWDKSRAVSINTEGLKAIPIKLEPTEQGLISGDDALRALADGKEVEFLHDSHSWVSALGLNIEQVIGGLFKLRLKPRTITLSLEFPAPMDRQPKAGERCCYVDFGLTSGFQSLIWEDDFSDFIDLWWDSEEKAKQAVAALRGIKG